MSSLPVRAQQPAQVNADAILARVKAHVRAHTRLPYVVYTLIRRDTFDDIPDLLNSYTLRIWCRTADDAALSRRTSGPRAIGDAEFIVPAFDKPIDPGPPTADLLDVIRQSAAPAPSPTPTGLRVIGSVSIAIETAYRVSYAGVDGAMIT